jgi:uncharacterized membrane protein YfcA
MMDIASLVAATVIVLFAGFTQGLTSMGFSLISVPLLSRIVPLSQAVPAVVILSLCTNIMIIRTSYRFVRIGRIWPMVIASLIAAPVGAALLVRIDAVILKIVVGTIIAGFSALLLAGKTFPVRNETFACIPVGVLSGLLNGSISMSGPPVALFLSNQQADKHTFRANITLYAIVLNVITIISYVFHDLMTRELATLTLFLVPAMFLGVAIGIYATKIVKEPVFRKIILVLIAVSGIWTVYDSVIGL